MAARVIQARPVTPRRLSGAHAPHRRLLHMLAPGNTQHEVVGRHGVRARRSCDYTRRRPCAAAAGPPAAPRMASSTRGEGGRHRHGGTLESAVRCMAGALTVLPSPRRQRSGALPSAAWPSGYDRRAPSTWLAQWLRSLACQLWRDARRGTGARVRATAATTWSPPRRPWARGRHKRRS